MNTIKGEKKNILLESFIKRLDNKIPGEREDLANITYDELKDALDEIGKDLVYNYLIFEKEVSFEVFLSNLKIYLNIIRNRL